MPRNLTDVSLSKEGTELFYKTLADEATLECITPTLGRTHAHGTIDMSFADLWRLLDEACSSDLGQLEECDIRSMLRHMKYCLRTAKIIMRVFELHAPCGRADLHCVGSSLSHFCTGTDEDICKAVFAVWDACGHGYIKKQSMMRYWWSVYMVEYDRNPRLQTRLGISAYQLAHKTTDETFMGLGIVGTITLPQFLAWSSEGLGAVQ